MVHPHWVRSGVGYSPYAEIDAGVTTFLIVILLAILLFSFNYPKVRKIGFKIVSAVVFIWGGFNVGIFIGVDIFQSGSAQVILMLVGGFLGLMTHFTVLKLINKMS